MKKVLLAIVLSLLVSASSYAYEKVPILMVHGMYGASSNWNTMKSWLKGEGYTDDLLFTINMDNNWSLCYAGHKEQIADRVDDILVQTGYDRVDVIGHSRGALNLYDYIHFAGGTETVRNFVSVAGALFMCGGSYGSDLTPGDQTAYTSIYSPDDYLVGKRPIDGANNVELSNINHITAIMNQTVFTYVMDALEGDGLNDGQPVNQEDPVINPPNEPPEEDPPEDPERRSSRFAIWRWIFSWWRR